MALLDAQAIAAAQDRRTKEIEIPAWGGSILLREIGALDDARLLDWLDRQTPRPAAGAPDAGQEDEAVTLVTTDSPGGAPEAVDAPAAEAEQEPPAVIPLSRYPQAVQTEWILRTLVAMILDPKTRRPAFRLPEGIEVLGARAPEGLAQAYAAAMDFRAETQESVGGLEKNSPVAAAGSGGV